MVKKLSPGKFEYPLETVLKVRGIRERKEQEQFADKKREYLDEKNKEETIEQKKKKSATELQNLLGGGKINDFERVVRRRIHFGLVKEELDKQIEKVIEASSNLEGQRQKLMDAMKNRKIIEKDKEHKLEEYSEMMKQLEIKFMDDIATARHQMDKKS